MITRDIKWAIVALYFIILECCFGATIIVPSEVATIQAALNVAQYGDLILIEDGTYYCNNLLVQSGITIQGYGETYLSGNYLNRVFCINDAVEVVLSNLHFINSKSEGGGAIKCVASEVMFDDCEFIGNSSLGDSYDGGAVLLDGTAAHFTDCIFDNNHSDGNGGAIGFSITESGEYMSIESPDIDFTFENCIFTQNHADGDGGAVSYSDAYLDGDEYIEVHTNNVWFNGCGYMHNEALGNGGAMYISLLHRFQTDPIIDVTLTEVVSEYNTCEGRGGLICIYSESTLETEPEPHYYGNAKLVVESSGFDNNNCGISGGAIYSQAERGSDISNSTFISNSADGELNISKRGGALYSEYTLVVRNCFFQLNNAATSGGAISSHVAQMLGGIEISDSEFMSNYTTDDDNTGGGAIYVQGGNAPLTISSSTFEDNLVNIEHTQDLIGDGGAINLNYTGEVLIEDCGFSNCMANNGGAIYLAEESTRRRTISNCQFTSCNANINGGAIGIKWWSYWNAQVSANCIVESCLFERCGADKGGGISWINPRYFQEAPDAQRCVGPDINACAFDNCTAVQSGGSLYFYTSQHWIDEDPIFFQYHGYPRMVDVKINAEVNVENEEELPVDGSIAVYSMGPVRFANSLVVVRSNQSISENDELSAIYIVSGVHNVNDINSHSLFINCTFDLIANNTNQRFDCVNPYYTPLEMINSCATGYRRVINTNTYSDFPSHMYHCNVYNNTINVEQEMQDQFGQGSINGNLQSNPDYSDDQYRPLSNSHLVDNGTNSVEQNGSQINVESDFDKTLPDIGFTAKFDIVDLNANQSNLVAGWYQVADDASIHVSYSSGIPAGTVFRLGQNANLDIDIAGSGGIAEIGGENSVRTAFSGIEEVGEYSSSISIDANDNALEFHGTVINGLPDLLTIKDANTILDGNHCLSELRIVPDLQRVNPKAVLEFVDCVGEVRNFSFEYQQNTNNFAVPELSMLRSSMNVFNCQFPEVTDPDVNCSLHIDGHAVGYDITISQCTFDGGSTSKPSLILVDTDPRLEENQFVDCQTTALNASLSPFTMDHYAENDFHAADGADLSRLVFLFNSPAYLECGGNSFTYPEFDNDDVFDFIFYKGNRPAPVQGGVDVTDYSRNFWGADCSTSRSAIGNIPSWADPVVQLTSCTVGYLCPTEIEQPFALLSTGLEAESSGNLAIAEETYSALIETFPESREASSAALRLKAMGLDAASDVTPDELQALAAASGAVNAGLSDYLTCASECVRAWQGDRPSAVEALTEFRDQAANEDDAVVAQKSLLEVQTYPAVGGLASLNAGTACLARDARAALRGFNPEAGLVSQESVTEIVEVPRSMQIASVFPNPFNPSTTIRYQLGSEMKLSVQVYNLQGQRVETLFEGSQNTGSHSLTWNAAGFATGVYFIHLQSEEIVQIRKVLLVR